MSFMKNTATMMFKINTMLPFEWTVWNVELFAATQMTEPIPSLVTKMKEKYSLISNFMVNNKLKLNTDKTHFMLITTAEKRRNRG